jgi:outer membrane protein OmpA-like peptidoglycan-associated protein
MKIKILIIFFVAFALKLNSQLVDANVALTGNVFNSISKEAETAAMILYDTLGNKIGATRSNSAENGAYLLSGLKPGKTYELRIRRKSYMETKYRFTVPMTSEYKEISKDFLITPLEVGGMVPIQIPPFELNKSKLRVGSEISLENYVSLLTNKENSNVKFSIVCYADNDKNKKENKELTSERVNALIEYFVSKGVDKSRIKGEGFDRTSPIDPPKNAKESKGKRYIGKTYIRIESF